LVTDIVVDADFPGGNIIVDGREGNTVYLRQDLRDTDGDWFYWYFRIRGAEGRTLNFQFTHSDVIGVRGPAVSQDGGATWRWMGDQASGPRQFSFDFDGQHHDVRFAFTIPYLEQDLDAFLERHRDDPHLCVGVLCKTGAGREVELLRLGKVAGTPRDRVLLTARHHACEAMASYALEGLLDAILADTETGRWLSERVEFLCIPFVDKDGVEQGDQGKNRHPHDHNRDYSDTPIYPSVGAIQELFETPIRVAFDFHCPARSGPLHEVLQFVEPRANPQERNAQEIRRFSELLEQHQRGPLPYSLANNLAFGQAWNVGDDFGKTFSSYADQRGAKLSVSLEVPYANASGQVVKPASARALGNDLAETLRSYLGTLETDHNA
jgi:hypothetical protein